MESSGTILTLGPTMEFWHVSKYYCGFGVLWTVWLSGVVNRV